MVLEGEKEQPVAAAQIEQNVVVQNEFPEIIARPEARAQPFQPNLGLDGAMAAADLLKSRREAILQVARRHGAGRIRVFGSYARGDAGEGSDLDLLIEIEGPTTPWFPGGWWLISRPCSAAVWMWWRSRPSVTRYGPRRSQSPRSAWLRI
jgi:hypothetical protein